MTSAFSSNEIASLEQCVEISSESAFNCLSDIWNADRLSECLQWIERNELKNICLQFPDNLLRFSANILDEIRSASNVNVYILGDTSYGSCCVDETAAAHINADSIIHFGHACLSKVTRLPVFYIFPNYKIETNQLVEEFHGNFSEKCEKIAIFYDVGYIYQLDLIKEALSSYTSIVFGRLAIDCEPDLLCWKTDELDFKDYQCVYIGKDDQSFFNLSISLQASKWLIYDQFNRKALYEITPQTSIWMRRRYYYIEKCKDAQSIGIVVGTLTAKGYLDIVKHIQNLARSRGIRSYLISVGKVNPAKLANFMEIDCFVLIGCPENNIYTSRDFYKPLLSVFEVEMALNPAWNGIVSPNYSIDFRDILPNGKLHKSFDGLEIRENDVSLVTGKIRVSNPVDVHSSNNGTENSNQLQERKNNNELMLSHSGSTFQTRSWTGLDPALGKTEATVMQKGRSGIAIKYSNNDNDNDDNS